MIAYRTIGDFIAARHRLTAYCGRGPHCWHGAKVDLKALAERLGKDFDLYRPELKERFRCTACGGRGATFTVSPP